MTEMILGCVMDEPRTAVFLCGEEYRIQISFFDPEGQLSYDSAHRENPVVIASRSGPDGKEIWEATARCRRTIMRSCMTWSMAMRKGSW